MPDWIVLGAIFSIGAVSYLMRVGGYLTASAFNPNGKMARLAKLAPSNMLVAFVAAGIMDGGAPYLAGCVAAAAVMAALRQEWLALGAGFGAAALASAML
ncbi:MAG: AzlD domain-containing protein [Elsteraceae bacterium]